MRSELRSYDYAERFAWAIAKVLGYHRTERKLLFALRLMLNLATSTTCVLWLLSYFHVVMADVGSNSSALSGIGFLSAPKELTCYIIDRAAITNSVQVIPVSVSPSAWDNDAMQQPFQMKWTCLGLSIWYRTRQCLAVVAVRYSTLVCFFVCCILVVHRASTPRDLNSNCPPSCDT